MPRVDHDTPGMVYACPECDGTTLRRRGPSKNVEYNPRKVYHCLDCKAGFNSPVERRDKRTTPGESDGELALEELAGEDDWFRKPDPDEPWRYACPDCGTTAVIRVPLQTEPDSARCIMGDWYGKVDDLIDKKYDDV